MGAAKAVEPRRAVRDIKNTTVADAVRRNELHRRGAECRDRKRGDKIKGKFHLKWLRVNRGGVAY